MSLWADLRDAIRKAILLEDRAERLIVDVGHAEERLIDHDRRLTREIRRYPDTLHKLQSLDA